MLLTAFAVLVPSASASYDLDADFNGGYVTMAYAGNASIYDMAIQNNGKIVIVGSLDSGTNLDILVIRLNPDASLDTSFGINGSVVTDLAGDDDTAYAVAIQSNGKIVVTGSGVIAGDTDFVIARYNTNGSLDTTFGSGFGYINQDIDYNTEHDEAHAIAIQSDGKIVVAGTASVSGELSFAAMRVDSGGNPDSTFSFNANPGIGIFANYDGWDDNGTSLALQDDGSIVIGGSRFNGVDHDFAILRVLPDGNADTSFNGLGQWQASYGEDALNDLVVDAQGRLIFAGSVDNGFGDKMIVGRLNTDGSIDTTFAGGVVIYGLDDRDDTASKILLQDADHIVLVGTSTDPEPMSRQFFARFDSEGTLDATFGTNGDFVTSVGNNPNTIRTGAFQADGKLVVAGDLAGTLWTSPLVTRYAEPPVTTTTVAPTTAPQSTLAVTGSRAERSMAWMIAILTAGLALLATRRRVSA